MELLKIAVLELCILMEFLCVLVVYFWYSIAVCLAVLQIFFLYSIGLHILSAHCLIWYNLLSDGIPWGAPHLPVDWEDHREGAVRCWLLPHLPCREGRRQHEAQQRRAVRVGVPGWSFFHRHLWYVWGAARQGYQDGPLPQGRPGMQSKLPILWLAYSSCLHVGSVLRVAVLIGCLFDLFPIWTVWLCDIYVCTA